MQETFKEIEREISTRKIEIKSKLNSSLNAFGNDQESIFSINSYVRASDYWKHMYRMSNKAKLAIEAKHDLCVDLRSALSLLEEHHLYLYELRKMYLPKNKDFILDGVEFARLVPSKYATDYTEILKKKALHFSGIQKTVVRGLEEFLERKIKSTERHILLFQGKDPNLIPKPVKFKQTEQLRLFEQSQESDTKLFWAKSDTDLVELITALFEANALRSNNGRVTKKQLHIVLESIFNNPIKEVRAKLYKIKCRKGKQDLFLHELKTAFLDGISRIQTPEEG
jgi:RteC protein